MSKTIRRDVLLRKAKAGKLIAVQAHKLTDDYAFDAAYGFGKIDGELPVHIMTWNPNMYPDTADPGKGGWERKSDHYNLYESDFQNHGRAWSNADGTITLYIHSNYTVTLREVA